METTKDPVHDEKKESSYRVSRGGCWNRNADYLVVSYRLSLSPGFRNGSLGFRPVRNVKDKR